MRAAGLLSVVVVASAVWAAPGLAPVVGRDLRHDLTPPLYLMAPKGDADVVSSTHEPLLLPKAGKSAGDGAPSSAPRIVPADAIAPMTPPILSFDGVSNRNGVAPPDAIGDVGKNHYVQWVNFSYAVWDKQGTLLYGPVSGNTIWSGFGGLCQTRNNGDAIVLYDPIADRWLLSQLAFVDSSEYHQCVAVSATPDPTGSWYRYDFLFSATTLNDYPKFGVWPDGYYLAINQFVGTNPRVFAGQGVMAFERDKMLQGLPAQTVFFDLFGVNPNYGGAQPSDLDGPVLPPPGAPNVFVEVDDDGFGWTPVDRLSLWNFHVDWAAPALSTFGVGGEPDQVIDLSAAGYPFDSNMCGYSTSCIPQLGTTRKIDALSDRLMYRVVYRNWPDHESLTLNHTVDVDGTDHAGVRWYELARAGGAWGIRQAGTQAPDALHRFMGSAAMDGSGDLAIGYSVSHGTLSPTVRYAGRVSGDPPGVLTRSEATLVPGAGAQTGLSRWGDYSMLSVDPVDDCTFWYTQEYYGATTADGWSTRVGSFRFPECVPCVLVENPALSVRKTAVGLELAWSAAANATSYDVVVGNLQTLRATGGNFVAGTLGCLVSAGAVTTVAMAGATVDPSPADGAYYLARAIGSQCQGTYDDGTSTPRGARDAALARTSPACP